MEGDFSTQVILAKSQAIVEGGYSPDIGIVIDLLQTKESIQSSMIPVALQAGLYMYRFQVPVGSIYRFRLSSRLSPLAMSSKQPSITRLIDYAISRAAADDGICNNHFQPVINGNELHLGEADYLALLAHGQCACPASSTTTAGSDYKVVGGCSKCPFNESRGREIGDAPENTGLGAPVGLDGYGKMTPSEDEAWPEHFEQRGLVSSELSHDTSDEPVASFPEPDEPATDDPIVFLAVDNSRGVIRRAVDDKDDFHVEEKWNGVGASGENGDCRQRCLHQPETSALFRPSDKEVEVEPERDPPLTQERDPLLTHGDLTTAHDTSSNDDSTEFNSRFRLGSSGVVDVESVLASARDETLTSAAAHPDSVLASAEPWAPAVHPDSALASTGYEPWPSGVEAKDDARETYVFERCQRNCVRASDRDNILFAAFDDQRIFLPPQLSDYFRQSLCSATFPLPSDVVRDLLQVISGNYIFRVLDESDLDPRRHPITGSDFEPLLMSTFEDSNPALSTIAEDALESHESKDRKLNFGTGMCQAISSEESEAVSETSSSSATRVTAVDTDADAIVTIDDIEIECGTDESHQVDFQVRLRFWRRTKLAVIRALQWIRDFFRGLFRGESRPRQPSSNRRGRLSLPSWTRRAERAKCDDLSKV